MKFRATVSVNTISASGPGRSYHRFPSSVGLGVSPYTRPCSCSAGRGRVSRLTTMVTTKHVTHAAIAVQNVWASSLGYVVTTPRYPPLTPTGAPAGSEIPWCTAAASMPEARPRNAPWPEARGQNTHHADDPHRGPLTHAD